MAKKVKKVEQVEKGAPAWMATFADLNSLLLTFFVLIVSMSSIQEAKFKVAIDSFRRALSWYSGQPPENRVPDVINPSQSLDPKKQENSSKSKDPIVGSNEMIRIAQEMQTDIRRLHISGQMQVYFNSSEIRIYIEDALMFEPGSSELKGKEAIHLLESILSLVKDIPYPLNIEGYTDPRPRNLGTGDYESNWELASARALRVLHYLNSHGISGNRLKAVAYGANRPKITDYSVPEEKRQNNRVEIAIRDTETE